MRQRQKAATSARGMASYARLAYADTFGMGRAGRDWRTPITEGIRGELLGLPDLTTGEARMLAGLCDTWSAPHARNGVYLSNYELGEIAYGDGNCPAAQHERDLRGLVRKGYVIRGGGGIGRWLRPPEWIKRMIRDAIKRRLDATRQWIHQQRRRQKAGRPHEPMVDPATGEVLGREPPPD